MPTTRTIQCADCQAEYATQRSNTKYCALCRIFRDVMYLGNRKQTCLVCEQKFALLQAGERLCPKCDVIPSSRYVDGTCAFCGTHEYPLLSAEVAVCTACAHDPEQRELFIKAIVQKRKLLAGTKVAI